MNKDTVTIFFSNKFGSFETDLEMYGQYEDLIVDCKLKWIEVNLPERRSGWLTHHPVVRRSSTWHPVACDPVWGAYGFANVGISGSGGCVRAPPTLKNVIAGRIEKKMDDIVKSKKNK